MGGGGGVEKALSLVITTNLLAISLLVTKVKFQFLTQFFFSECALKNAWRYTLMRAAWYGLLSTMANL